MPRLSKQTLAAVRKYGPSVQDIAQQYGISGEALLAKLVIGESGDRGNAVSSAGARGWTQFMPGSRQTAIQKYGVDPWADPDQAVHGAALHLRGKINGTPGLKGYNPGSSTYTSYILGQKVGDIGGASRPAQPAAAAGAAPQATQTVATPGVNNAPLRRQAVAQFLQQGGIRNPNAVMNLAGTYGSLADRPGQAAPADTTYAQPQPKGQTPTLKTGPIGAQTALSWAKSKVGDPGSKETSENHGRLADYANSRFGMSGQPWCAMFTSMAVTKGGAPKTARTASVAEVRRQAEQGGGGYQRGFVKNAKAGDLILFGSSHIGMVDHVEDGKIWYVGGNQSDNVTLASVPVGGGDIVRPKYGTRKKK